MKKNDLILFLTLMICQICIPVCHSREVIYYKNSPHSLVNWDNINLDTWSDYSTWKNNSDKKKELPDWEINLRDRRLIEGVGRVVGCYGECKNYRDNTQYRIKFRSKIMEGDELRTVDNSYLWVFLYDGTMVRLSPNSSISFKEINIGKSKVFFHVRINVGHVLWLSRSENTYIKQTKRETDTLFLPMEFKEARPQLKQTKVDEENLFALLDTENSQMAVYKRLNKLITENNTKIETKKVTRSFLILPNSTIVGDNLNIEMIVLGGGKTYFKERSLERLGISNENMSDSNKGLAIYMRGFENEEVNSSEREQWYEIDEKGRSLSTFDETRNYILGEFVTKRIPSILTARELMLKKYSLFVFKDIKAEALGATFGYRLWEKFLVNEETDLALREKFLISFSRRQETQNLVISDLFFRRRLKRGEKIKVNVYDNSYFAKALSSYVNHLDSESQYHFQEDFKLMNSMKKKFWKKIHEK